MIKKIRYLFCIIFALLLLLFCSKTFAATANLNIKVSKEPVTVGDTITITVSGNAASWQLRISGTINEIMADATKLGENEDVTMGTYTYKTTEAGTLTFTLTGQVVGINSEKVYKSEEVNETKTVTVIAAPEPPPPTTTDPDPSTTTPEQPEQPETPTTPQEQVTFKDVNETVYVTGTSVNVRASYSSSSQILGTLKKGAEITRTGVGSNGWSRINYNGTTAYISSDYISTTKPQETEVKEEKSSNANLKSLVVEGYDLVPSFSLSTVSYTLQVKNDITELNIKAEAEDEKATISIQGEKDLKEGENLVTISVSAEDGTVKVYEIKVTRLSETTLGLSSLKIEGTDIEDKFKTDVYEYQIQIKELTELNIEAIANDETATVEILGNENLEEGENIITIIVSSEDGSEKVTYQIKAKKLLVSATTQEKKIDSNIYLYIVLGIVLLITLIIVIIYTIKYRNYKEYEEDSFEGFPDELPERLEENESENKQKSKLDYFLDTKDDEGTNNKKGRHF